MEVSMANPVNAQIHLSQAVPRSSSLTWTLDGDADKNEVHVSQNAADENSPLNCSPDCPQKESDYSYDYEGDESGNAVVAPPPPPPPQQKPQRRQQQNNRNNQRNNSGNRRNNGGNKNKGGQSSRRERPKSSGGRGNGGNSSKGSGAGNSKGGFQGKQGFTTKDAMGCPGGSLDACNKGCPTKYGNRVIKVCQTVCKKRC
jgi:type II secretory pathway component GspD/PulD (secretin)